MSINDSLHVHAGLIHLSNGYATSSKPPNHMTNRTSVSWSVQFFGVSGRISGAAGGSRLARSEEPAFSHGLFLDGRSISRCLSLECSPSPLVARRTTSSFVLLSLCGALAWAAISQLIPLFSWVSDLFHLPAFVYKRKPNRVRPGLAPIPANRSLHLVGRRPTHRQSRASGPPVRNSADVRILRLHGH